MTPNKIKLIIIDFYGVMTFGSYKETCQWLARKYKLDYDYLYDIVYHKYFSKAAVGKITERASFALPIKELGLKETWQELRRKHLSFQKLNKSVFDFCLDLQKQDYTILLLSKNTPWQFNYALRKMNIRKYFKNIINTFDLKLPKASPKTIKYVLKKYKVKPNEAIMADDQNFNLVEANKLGVKTILYKNFKQFKNEMDKYLKPIEIQGVVASPGKVRGIAKIIRNSSQVKKIKKGDIVITPISKLSFIPADRRDVAGFIVDQGGITCHIATVAREMKKPCLVNTQNAVKLLKDEDLVEIDADKGVVRIVNRK